MGVGSDRASSASRYMVGTPRQVSGLGAWVAQRKRTRQPARLCSSLPLSATRRLTNSHDHHRGSGTTGARLQYADGVDLAWQQEARGWAIAGDYDHCQLRLDQAANHLATAQSEAAPGTPAYIHHYGPDVLEEQAATCYRDLGRTEQAITIFQRKVNELPHGHDSDRGYRMATLAVAYAHNHHPQPAASLGLQALTLARHTGSARTDYELQPLAGQRSRWRTQPGVASFIDALRTPRT
jgi:hypothetical protein